MIDKDKYITYCGMDVSEYLDENCKYNVGDGGECPIYVPAESVNAYKTASGWSEYADRIHPI